MSRTAWEHCQWNQLHRTPDTEVTKILYGSYLGPLHIPYGCIAHCSWGTSNNGIGGYLWLFCLTFGTLSPILGCLFQPWYEGLRLSYYNLLGHVWWMSIGDLLFLLLFFQKRMDLREMGGVGRDWEKIKRGKLQSGYNVWEKHKGGESRRYSMEAWKGSFYYEQGSHQQTMIFLLPCPFLWTASWRCCSQWK